MHILNAVNCEKLFENKADLAVHLEREDEENRNQIAVSVKRKKDKDDSNRKKAKITDVIVDELTL